MRPGVVRCDQFALGKKPIAGNYIHTDYKDVDAVAPGMGNHLIDLTALEFKAQRFTRTWIFGIYGGDPKRKLLDRERIRALVSGVKAKAEHRHPPAAARGNSTRPSAPSESAAQSRRLLRPSGKKRPV